jgi:hypothetical protein
MNDWTQDTPWSAVTPALAAAAPKTGVDVLPPYAPDATTSTMATLSVPWSARPPVVSARPAISSLHGLAMIA